MDSSDVEPASTETESGGLAFTRMNLEVLFTALHEWVFDSNIFSTASSKINMIREAFPDWARVQYTLDMWEHNANVLLQQNVEPLRSFLYSGPGVSHAPAPKVNYDEFRILLGESDNIPDGQVCPSYERREQQSWIVQEKRVRNLLPIASRPLDKSVKTRGSLKLLEIVQLHHALKLLTSSSLRTMRNRL